MPSGYRRHRYRSGRRWYLPVPSVLYELPGWLPLRLLIPAGLVALLGFGVVVSGAGREQPSRAGSNPPVTTAAVSPHPSAPPDASVPPAAPGGSPAAGDTGGTGGTGVSRSPRSASCAGAMAAAMSVEQRAGQVVMVGVPVTDPRSAVDVVRRSRLGGVFLAGRSTGSADALRGALRAVQEAALRDVGVAVHIAVDQEGGKVQTLRGPGFGEIPSAVEQGGWDTATLRRRTGDWARGLAGAGVTLDLAPVADTVAAGTARDNPPIGAFDRQFGATADAVGADVQTVITAMQDSGLLATAKHFPGLGRVRHNTDTSAGAVDGTADAGDPNLAPFRTAVAAGTAAVMMSLARYPRLDPREPAVFSRPIVTDLLRGQLGFGGMVVSDDLGAAVAVQSVPVGERAVRFVAAGGDLVLSVRRADAGPMTGALAAEAHRAPAFAQRLTEAATAVLASKERLGMLDCPAAPPDSSAAR